MLSAWVFAVCEVWSDTCSSCQLKSLSAVGRELNCINVPCFLSLKFHIRRMKTGWESGALTTVFVLHFVNISEKRCGFLSRMWLSVVAEAMLAAARKDRPFPMPTLYLWCSAHTLETHLIPATTENEPSQKKN